jgi:hypothetical protein
VLYLIQFVMKYFNLLKITSVLALVVMLGVGCRKDYNRPVGSYYTPVSAVAFFNASPDAPTVGLMLDNNTVTGTYAYPDRSYYFYAYTGTRKAAIVENNIKKTTANIVLKDGKYYSLFLTGPYATSEFTLLEDSIKSFAPDKVNIRFVNMSAGAPSLDLGLTDGTTLVSGRTYKQNSAYISVNGNTTYNFVIRDHGSTVAKVTLPATLLNTGRHYTIWAKGIYTGTGAAALGGEIDRNY